MCPFVGARGMYVLKTSRINKTANFNTVFSGKNIDIDHEEPVNFHIQKYEKGSLSLGMLGSSGLWLPCLLVFEENFSTVMVFVIVHSISYSVKVVEVKSLREILESLAGGKAGNSLPHLC